METPGLCCGATLMGACIVIDVPNSEVDRPTSAAQTCRIRVLCLGNDLLGDDSLGWMAAACVRQFAPADVEVLNTSEAGFRLLDYLLDVDRLIVIDTVVTGSAPPGTIYEIRESQLRSPPGGSPHYVGFLEAVTLSKYLGLPVAKEVFILAVEATNCSTMGGDMHPAVRAAIRPLVETVRNRIGAVDRFGASHC